MFNEIRGGFRVWHEFHGLLFESSDCLCERLMVGGSAHPTLDMRPHNRRHLLRIAGELSKLWPLISCACVEAKAINAFLGLDASRGAAVALCVGPRLRREGQPSRPRDATALAKSALDRYLVQSGLPATPRSGMRIHRWRATPAAKP